MRVMNMRHIYGRGLSTVTTSLSNLTTPKIPSTSDTLSSALQSYINSDYPSHGQKIHAHILKSGFIPNTNISIKLLILHIKCNSMRYAHQVFDELSHRTLTAYNYMIGGYLKHGMVEESLGFVRRLVSAGETPDRYTFSMILKASSSRESCRVRLLEKLAHACMIRLSVALDDVICTALVDSYVKKGRLCYARRVFDSMLGVDVVCSTSMITGYTNLGRFDEAEEIFAKTSGKDLVVFNAMIEGFSRSMEGATRSLEVFVELQRSSFRPNISTFASVIGACAVLASHEFGLQVQSQIMKTELFGHIKIGSALVDMYSKCGRVEDANRIFNHMAVKNVFTWTSMIDGYGKCGDSIRALELFRSMRRDFGVEPNLVTFLGAIWACGHAGLVEEGLEIFESIERDHGLRPGMEHYTCVVDLCGRAGDFERALGIIRAMPVKPNSDVWGALLSACRLHGNVELASLAANEVFRLDGQDRPGAYVTLSNTMAEAGKWESVTQVRDTMKVFGILKGSGSSWVSGDC